MRRMALGTIVFLMILMTALGVFLSSFVQAPVYLKTTPAQVVALYDSFSSQTTLLREQEIEKFLVGKRVDWEGIIEDVEQHVNYGTEEYLFTIRAGSSGQLTVLLICGGKRGEQMAYDAKIGEHVTFEGEIRSMDRHILHLCRGEIKTRLPYPSDPNRSLDPMQEPIRVR